MAAMVQLKNAIQYFDEHHKGSPEYSAVVSRSTHHGCLFLQMSIDLLLDCLNWSKWPLPPSNTCSFWFDDSDIYWRVTVFFFVFKLDTWIIFVCWHISECIISNWKEGNRERISGSIIAALTTFDACRYSQHTGNQWGPRYDPIMITYTDIKKRKTVLFFTLPSSVYVRVFSSTFNYEYSYISVTVTLCMLTWYLMIPCKVLWEKYKLWPREFTDWPQWYPEQASWGAQATPVIYVDERVVPFYVG